MTELPGDPKSNLGLIANALKKHNNNGEELKLKRPHSFRPDV